MTLHQPVEKWARIRVNSRDRNRHAREYALLITLLFIILALLIG